MLIERLKQIQFTIFFDLHSQIIQLLNRSITGKEILRTRSEGNDFQIFYSDERAGNRNEIMNKLSAIIGISYGIFGNIRFHVAKFQIITRIEHSAIRIASVRRKYGNIFFRSGTEHHGIARLRGVLLREHRFAYFGSEIAEIYTKSVATVIHYVRKSLFHMNFTFHDTYGTLIYIPLAVFLLISLNKRTYTIQGQTFRETIPRHRNDTNFNFRNVLHN